MLISGKGKCFHVFGCISKNFPENIFWCLEKKKENTNPEKHKPQPRSSPTTAPSIAIRDRDRRRDRNLAFFARSRSTARSREGEIAIFARSRSTARSREASIAISDLPLSPTYAISRSTLHEIVINGDWNVCRRDRDWRGLELGVRRRLSDCASSHARARSLSLCKIFRKYFEGKIEV